MKQIKKLKTELENFIMIAEDYKVSPIVTRILGGALEFIEMELLAVKHGEEKKSSAKNNVKNYLEGFQDDARELLKIIGNFQREKNTLTQFLKLKI